MKKSKRVRRKTGGWIKSAAGHSRAMKNPPTVYRARKGFCLTQYFWFVRVLMLLYSLLFSKRVYWSITYDTHGSSKNR